jgi:hypothetical protein
MCLCSELYFLKLLFIYSHVRTLFGLFLPPPSLLGRTCSALISNFAEEKHDKKAFLLV